MDPARAGNDAPVSISLPTAPRLRSFTPTMWTPSRSPRCGVAQYTGELVGALHGIGLAAWLEPPLDDSGLLHLQHEHSLIAPERVADIARRTPDRGVPLVVTEHTVRRQVDDWEGDVVALVAHSA